MQVGVADGTTLWTLAYQQVKGQQVTLSLNDHQASEKPPTKIPVAGSCSIRLLLHFLSRDTVRWMRQQQPFKLVITTGAGNSDRFITFSSAPKMSLHTFDGQVTVSASGAGMHFDL